MQHGLSMSSLRFHHIGIAVPDLDAAVASYEKLLGCRLIDGPYEDPVQKARVCFLNTPEAGHPTIECVAPASPDSHVHRLIGKGAGAYHLCYEVPDLAAALETARAAGCLLVSGPVPAVAFGGRSIAWLYAPSRTLLELVER